jgi:SAM-dependent methyltransferase
VKERLKSLVARLMRPGLADLDRRLSRVEESLTALSGRPSAGEKHEEELAYWRWLFKSDEGRASLFAPPEQAFALWQRQRLRELARTLGLAPAAASEAALDAALDAWCERQSVIEIGAGPYPNVAAAPRWRRAVAVDPIARAYAEEGILPAAASHVTYIEAPGERVPLASEFADLVIIENALDHVSDPAAVLSEIGRLLRPGGLLWLLVDLSTYSDHMHPHPFDEERVRALLAAGGFDVVSDRVSDHKSHPKAYGEYRGLLRKPGGSEDRPLTVQVRASAAGAAAPQASPA